MFSICATEKAEKSDDTVAKRTSKKVKELKVLDAKAAQNLCKSLVWLISLIHSVFSRLLCTMQNIKIKQFSWHRYFTNKTAKMRFDQMAYNCLALFTQAP